MRDRRQASALIVTLGILTILSMMAIMFANLMRIEARASVNVMDNKRCEFVALTGLAHAVSKIYSSDTNDVSDQVFIDTLTPEPEGFALPEGGTPTLKGVYSITFYDCGARLDVNACGQIDASLDNDSSEGWTTADISLKKLFLNAGLGGVAQTYAQVIVTDSSYGRQRGGTPSNSLAVAVQSDGIDNDGDGTIDEADGTERQCAYALNPEVPAGNEVPFSMSSELDLVLGSAHANSSSIRKLFVSNDLHATGRFLTTMSRHATYLHDGVWGAANGNSGRAITGKGKLNINTASAAEINAALTEAGVNEDTRNYIIAYINDYRDNDQTVEAYNGKYGFEAQPVISEVLYCEGGRAVELYNPFSVDVDLENWVVSDGTGSYTFGAGETIAAGAYVVVTYFDTIYAPIVNAGATHVPQPDPFPASTDLFTFTDNPDPTITLSDGTNIRDTVDWTEGTAPLGLSLDTSKARTDPRNDVTKQDSTTVGPEVGLKPGDSYKHTLGLDNDGFDVSSTTFVVRDNDFANIGELARVIIRDDADANPLVFTDDWSSDDPGYLDMSVAANRSIFNWLTVLDGRDASGYIRRGLVNINSAATAVLEALPNVDATTAANISGNRGAGYTSIGELLDSGGADVDVDVFAKIGNLITVRSDTYVVVVDAEVQTVSGSVAVARRKLVAIVDRTEPSDVRVLAKGWFTE